MNHCSYQRMLWQSRFPDIKKHLENTMKDQQGLPDGGGDQKKYPPIAAYLSALSSLASAVMLDDWASHIDSSYSYHKMVFFRTKKSRKLQPPFVYPCPVITCTIRVSVFFAVFGYFIYPSCIFYAKIEFTSLLVICEKYFKSYLYV